MDKYQYIPDFKYDKGWDKYAISYAKLQIPNSLYNLTKTLAHNVIDHYLPKNPIKVLDLNCGTGNDFNYFINRGAKVTGTDGSAGMLNKASEIFQSEISAGKIELYQLMLENLDPETFKGMEFDLIYSITGGYSYIDDATFKNVNNLLKHHLKPNGFIITGHLTPFCWGEFMHYAKRLQFKASLTRLKQNLKVPIKGEKHRMFLRSYHKLKQLKTPGLNFINCHPILTTTPPYQTQVEIDEKAYQKLWKKEEKRLFTNRFNYLADQVLMVEQKPSF